MKIETRGPDGEPACPVCGSEVPEAGQFDQPSCMEHFLVAVQGSEIVFVDDEILDVSRMPWYSQDNAA